MKDLAFRILTRRGNGMICDERFELDLAFFGGVVPVPGDLILDPGATQGADRSQPENRTLWIVRERIFNTKDLEGAYIALVVDKREVAAGEIDILPG